MLCEFPLTARILATSSDPGFETMNHEVAKIKARLEEVLESIFCPVGGC